MSNLPYQVSSGEVYRKMVMVNMVFVSLGLPDLDGGVRLQGIAFPDSHRRLRCRVTPTYKRSSSPIRSGGGGPYRTVRTQCKSGVRIKIPESGSRCIHIQFGMIRGSGPRPDPESFAFCIFDEFFMDPDPGSCHTQQL
jgi:hypothetical protein